MKIIMAKMFTGRSIKSTEGNIFLLSTPCKFVSFQTLSETLSLLAYLLGKK
jgi:hypothetical protein